MPKKKRSSKSNNKMELAALVSCARPDIGDALVINLALQGKKGKNKIRALAKNKLKYCPHHMLPAFAACPPLGGPYC